MCLFWHILFCCTKIRLSQAYALLFSIFCTSRHTNLIIYKVHFRSYIDDKMILSAEIVNPFWERSQPFLRKEVNLFCGKGQPFLWKRSTLFEKRSTLFEKKVNPFCGKGQPFLRKRLTLFERKVNPFYGKGQLLCKNSSTLFKKQSSECNKAYTILAFNFFSFPLSELCLIFLLFGFLTFASLIHLFTFFFFYLWISVLSRFFLLLLCTRDLKLIKTYE